MTQTESKTLTPSKTEDTPKTLELSEDFIRSLPKTDLHVHLDGSLRVSTMLEMAEEQKVKLPAEDPDKLKAFLVPTREECTSLVDYLKAFDTTLSVLQKAPALERAAYELAEDCHRENIRYFEVRFSPILHQKEGLSLAAIVQSVVDGLDRASEEFGIMSGVILCGIRSMDPEISIRLAELTIAFKDKGVVAFDLAGGEEDNPAKRHREAFYRILNNNINCTIHAGEAYGPESIHQAIHYCGAHRIGHGARLREDGSLLNYVNDHRIPIECCITSNVQTRAIDNFESHPIRDYYDYGLRVTVNTDNRLISDTTVTRELKICVDHLGFDSEGLRHLIVHGFKSAFLPYHTKSRLLKSISRELAEKFGGPASFY